MATALVAAAIDWWSVQAGNDRLEQFAKPAVMLALIASVVAADMTGWSLVWLLTALVLGLAGDVLLLPSLDRFVEGLAAFLLGHLAYAALGFTLGTRTWWLILGLVLATVLVWTVGTRISDAVQGTDHFAPVVAYVLAIGLGAAVLVGTGRWLLLVGAVLFTTSDALLGWGRFVGEAPGDRLAVHVTYHLGQTALVLGALGA
jgi:uncharacterized membrane protein YhhN